MFLFSEMHIQHWKWLLTVLCVCVCVCVCVVLSYFIVKIIFIPLTYLFDLFWSLDPEEIHSTLHCV